MIVPILIIALSLAGLTNAIYFTLAYYGRVKNSRWVPEILCAREGSSCVTVVQTPYARVFGVPNSLLGIIYYVLLIAWTALRPALRLDLQFLDQYFVVELYSISVLLVSVGAVALGFYLIYALRRILHIDCPLCYTAHAINFALFVLLIFPSR
jgi:uncharacterized membrane protein